MDRLHAVPRDLLRLHLALMEQHGNPGTTQICCHHTFTLQHVLEQLGACPIQNTFRYALRATGLRVSTIPSTHFTPDAWCGTYTAWDYGFCSLVSPDNKTTEHRSDRTTMRMRSRQQRRSLSQEEWLAVEDPQWAISNTMRDSVGARFLLSLGKFKDVCFENLAHTLKLRDCKQLDVQKIRSCVLSTMCAICSLLLKIWGLGEPYGNTFTAIPFHPLTGRPSKHPSRSSTDALAR